MKKTFFTKEVKIGLSFVVALAFLIWGINFLKGVNLFTPSNHYYLKYENVDGLVVSNGVFIKGYKVGQVRAIKYDFTQKESFVVDILMNQDIKLPEGTIAYLFDESMLGGKGINLVFSEETNYHTSGDTLTTDVQKGLMASLAGIVPSIQSTINHADSLILSANALINSSEIQNSLTNFESITAELHKTSRGLTKMIDQEFPSIINNVNGICTDLKTVTNQLSNVQYKDIVESLDSTLVNLEEFTNRINSPNGTLGLLLNDKALYNNINTTVNSVNNLLIDFKDDPRRYLYPLGKKKKKQ
ncbi:MAG: MCE family protein [Paludibacteraceae bacterium]|nr:MCE family protein [Paludibacteraceae bacterium]MBQ8721025.1 MCE family protein [Paludibacteraceae bacterium]